MLSFENEFNLTVSKYVKVKAFNELRMFQAKNLSAHRDHQLIFDQVNFCVKPGQILQIIGGNGIGKTTLLKSLLGLFSLSHGAVYWQGKEIDQQRQFFQQSCGFIGHNFGLTSELSVEQQLLTMIALKQQSPFISIDYALRAIGLPEYLSQQNCMALSQGQQKKVALALLWLLKIPCWFIDEPLANLDPSSQLKVMQKLFTLAEQGIVSVVTSHRDLSAQFKFTNFVTCDLGQK